MTQGDSDLVSVELTPAEAQLVIAALKRFVPYWPSGLDELSRAELLAEIRQGIEHVVELMNADSAAS